MWRHPVHSGLDACTPQRSTNLLRELVFAENGTLVILCLLIPSSFGNHKIRCKSIGILQDSRSLFRVTIWNHGRGGAGAPLPALTVSGAPGDNESRDSSDCSQGNVSHSNSHAIQ